MSQRLLPEDSHLAKFLNEILAKGYRMPLCGVLSGEMLHFCEGVKFSPVHLKELSLVLFYQHDTQDYYLCYMNAGSATEYWHQMITRFHVKEKDVAQILELILRKLDTFLSIDGDYNTIDSATLIHVLDG